METIARIKETGRTAGRQSMSRRHRMLRLRRSLDEKNVKSTRLGFFLPLFSAFILCACSSTPYYEDTLLEEGAAAGKERKKLTAVQKPIGSSSQLEASAKELKMKEKRVNALNSKWSQQPFSAVVEAFGQPRMIMTMPTGSGGTIAVFGLSDKDSQCIDAFSLQHKEGEGTVVVEYFCR